MSKPKIPKEYVVAVPTYHRSETIGKKTLATLIRGKVPPEKIHLFVANESEKSDYTKILQIEYPHYPLKNIHVGIKGITAQRRFISQFFPAQTPIVSLDDDVEQVYQLAGYRPFSAPANTQKRKTQRRISQTKENQRAVKIVNLDTFFRRAFEYTLEHSLSIWGVYPVNNPFFMKPKTTTDLRFLIGGLYGYINRPTAPDLRVTVPIKEDFENTILHFKKDGGVVRFNGVSYKSKNYSPGGLEKAEARLESNRRASEMLLRRYPQYVVEKPTRASGVMEIGLVKNPEME
jgi:hypothetical protein